MAIQTLRPNGTASGSATLTGAASAHAALNDDSDSSYIVAPTYGSTVKLNLDDYSLPAGDIVIGCVVRLRAAVSGGGLGNTRVILNGVDTVALTTDVSLSGSSPITFTAVTVPGTTALEALWTDANVDTWQLELSALPGSTTRIYEAYVDLVHIPAPTVTVTAPSGTFTTTNVPTVTWTVTKDSVTSGGATSVNPFTFYRAKIFSAAQYGAGGFDPETSTSTAHTDVVSTPDWNVDFYGVNTWTPTFALPNATYRAYVRVSQVIPGAVFWPSAWAYSGFVINVTAPSAPTLTATLDDTHGRVTLALDDAAGTTTDLFELQRSTDAGTTWEAPRVLRPSLGSLPTPTVDGSIIVPAAGLATVYDYESPIGTAVLYRARALHNYSGLYAAGAWTSNATVTSTSSQWWLKAPESPALNLAVTVNSLSGYQRPGRMGVFQALGRTDTVIVEDTRSAQRGTLKLQTELAADRTALDALLDSGITLFLQGPVSHDEPDRYVRFGDQDRQRRVDNAFLKGRVDTLQWWEVASPAGYVDAWP